MLQELLTIFRSGNPLEKMAADFAEMLDRTREMILAAGEIYFGKPVPPEERTKIYHTDIRVNQLERAIRKQVVAHLSVRGDTRDLPYCLLLMSLVKDVERIGDYAKNLTELVEVHPGALPDDEIVAELREIRTGVEETFAAAAGVFADSDRERALPLIRKSKDEARRADNLVLRIAHAGYDGAVTTSLVLGTRYYKRVGAHLLNLLSSVVMPLHKVDYYDEDEIPRLAGDET